MHVTPDATIESSARLVAAWVEARHYRGYEPFDGLSSFLAPLARSSQLLERVLLQLVRQAPVNLRSLLGIRPQDSTKGRGYMAWGYLEMYRRTGDGRFAAKAHSCLEWLRGQCSPDQPGCSWGNHFPFTTRIGTLPRLEPIIVWTSLIGQAFLDGYELLGEADYLTVAREVCRWILSVPRERTDSGTCLSYVAFEQRSIHNANMLGAAMLARTAAHTGESELREVAREAMRYSCTRQRSDGSWYYGEEPGYQWIDNFHTGYNLDSLQRYLECTGDEELRPNLHSGIAYYRASFFDADGRPRYYHDRAFPIDIQCAAQSIETLALCARDERELELAVRVAEWTIANMQATDGHFYYRRLPLLTVKTPMLHWGQATMFKALAALLVAMTGGGSDTPAAVDTSNRSGGLRERVSAG